MPAAWSADRRLDILVLGPMGADDTPEASTLPVQQALQALLAEEAFVTLLNQYGIGDDAEVWIPVGETPADIMDNVLRRVDTADLVVFNLMPKPDNPDRANVFYELGLVHALGIPALLVVRKGEEKRVPFYASGSMLYTATAFTVEALADALRAPLLNFLDLDNRDDSTLLNDRLTQFYGLPIVDISAAVGLATGYYDNFLARLIRERGFLAVHPETIQHVVYVRPSSLGSTYEADLQALTDTLSAADLELEETQLPAIPQDNKGRIWFHHVGSVVLDVPRTIYPLRRSPRLFSFLERTSTVAAPNPRRALDQRQTQIEQVLLDRVETALKYQVRRDGPDVRSRILHYTTIQRAPALVQQLRGG